MKKIIKNLSGIYLAFKNDNYRFVLSKEKINDKLQNFPSWMKDQIDEDFSYFSNKRNDIKVTIDNFKKNGFLKEAQLVRIKILNNKFEYQNFLPVKFHPRFIRLQNFFKTASKAIKFPDVEFLYSIHDSFDNDKWLECLRSPIFCISKLKDNKNVILFPHIEWMQKNEFLLNSICKAALHFDWNNKINKAFWRGAITGFEDLKKNERFKIVKFATQYPDFFDVGFSNINLIKKDKKTTKNYLKKDKYQPCDQLEYKYLLSIDGNAFAGSFFWQLFSNSVILKNQSNYLEWYYSKLNNNEHYVEFSSEKELLQKIIFLNKNENFAKSIIKNANDFANVYLTNENIIVYIYKLLEKYKIAAKSF